MTASVFIYSHESSPALLRDGRQGLEAALQRLLGQDGDVTGGGSGTASCAWNIDLEITDSEALESWLLRLASFLRAWGAPADTYIHGFPENWVEGMQPITVLVFPRAPITESSL